MKSTDKNIEEEVLKTLGSLEGLEKGKVSPFFYTRLEARLEGSKSGATNVWVKWQWAFLLVFVLINFLGIYSYYQGGSSNTVSDLEQMQEEYGLVSYTIDDYITRIDQGE